MNVGKRGVLEVADKSCEEFTEPLAFFRFPALEYVHQMLTPNKIGSRRDFASLL